MPIEDHYKTLGLDQGASEAEIKAAFRRLVKKWHPDKNKSPKANEMFRRIYTAYEELKEHFSRTSGAASGFSQHSASSSSSQPRGSRSSSKGSSSAQSGSSRPTGASGFSRQPSSSENSSRGTSGTQSGFNRFKSPFNSSSPSSGSRTSSGRPSGSAYGSSSRPSDADDRPSASRPHDSQRGSSRPTPSDSGSAHERFRQSQSDGPFRRGQSTNDEQEEQRKRWGHGFHYSPCGSSDSESDDGLSWDNWSDVSDDESSFDDEPNESEGLPREPPKDRQYAREFEEKQAEADYQEMQDYRRRLPSNDEAKDICKTVAANQVTVISGETGCGKTTQVPQFILDEFIKKGQGSQCHIICTQPRRMSAVSVATRVAVERGEDPGKGSVGYQIGLDVKRPRKTGSILFCTIGIVLKMLESDPLLNNVSHIVLDEVHERDLDTDFLLTIVKHILPRRPKLKLILMSATMNAARFSKYCGSCPMLTIPGRMFPVDKFYLEDVIEKIGYKPSNYRPPRKSRDFFDFERWVKRLPLKYSRSTQDTLKQLYHNQYVDIDLLAAVIRHISTTTELKQKEKGSILVFLPGWDDINHLHKALLKQKLFDSDYYLVLRLHGSLMPKEEQDLVLERPEDEVRKIILATNVAETSITIEDVVYVVDCGKTKLTDFDPRKNMSSLQTVWSSKANSTQRRGRAGRVQAGVCYHLYTKFKENQLPEYHPPEILRSRLEDICLKIKLLRRGKIMSFFKRAMDKPKMVTITKSIELLVKLGALDEEEEMTPLGYHLARLPVEVRVGKMLLYGALFCCLDPILTIAACFDDKSPFVAPPDKHEKADKQKLVIADGTLSDHLMFVNGFNGWSQAGKNKAKKEFCQDNFLSNYSMWNVQKRRQQLAETLHKLNFIKHGSPFDQDANKNSDNLNIVRAVLCAGLYPNIGNIVKNPKYGRPGASDKEPEFLVKSEDGVEFYIHPKSVNYGKPLQEKYKYVVFYHKMETSRMFLHDVTGISSEPVHFFRKEAVDPAIESLRKDFSKVLKKKFEDPAPTTWSDRRTEGKVLTAVLKCVAPKPDYN